MPNVVTANRLVDGIVVYLAAGGEWTEDIGRARLAETEEETKALEEEAARDVDARKVVAAYPMEVAVKDGEVDALSVRERIRAAGPTIRKDLGKQAQQ